MTIQLQTNDQNKVLELQDYHNNSISILVSLNEGLDNSYRIKKKFWELPKVVLQNFINELENMDNKHTGKAVLRNGFEQDYLEFQTSEQGKVFITFKVSDSVPDANIKISFITDQTVLNTLISSLKELTI
jgi:hypothetical protein